MKKRLLLFLFFVVKITIGFGQGPSIEWQRSLGGSNDDNAEAIIVTHSGNYLIAGGIESYDGDVAV